MTEATLSLSPTPQYRPKDPPWESEGINDPTEKGAVDLWGGIFALICRLTDVLQRVWVNSLDTVIWTKFGALKYEAPKPPWFMTVEQREKCNPKIIEVFCKVMANYRKAADKNPHILAYTHYSPSLEKIDFEPLCHNALYENVRDWTGDKTEIQVGKPQREMKDYRYEVSIDFLRAFFPLADKVTKLTISGPLDEKGVQLFLQEIPKIASLQELTLELDKKTAETLAPSLHKLLTNVTKLNFINYEKEKDFKTVPEEIWEALRTQNTCEIHFTNVPKPPEPHNKLTFKSQDL